MHNNLININKKQTITTTSRIIIYKTDIRQIVRAVIAEDKLRKNKEYAF
jgi:hypothetical protein